MTKKIKVITIANFRKQKDYTTNIKTCLELQKKSNNFLFIYVGTGKTLSKTKKLAEKHNLNISFLGERTDIKELLESSDIFFLPSLYEGQCNALIEAMKYKIPIVTTDIEENRVFLEHNKTALLCKRKDYKQMAHTITCLAENKELQNTLIKNALEKSKIFSAEKMVAEYLKVYSEVVGTSVESLDLTGMKKN